MAVAPDRAADRPQLDAVRQRTAQGLKHDAAAPAFQGPCPERVCDVVARGADRERKGRHERKLVEPDFALDVLLVTHCEGQTPAQPRIGNDAVEIVEGQFVADKRKARGQTDVWRQRVGPLEIEQRGDIGASYPQVDAGLGLLRPWLGRPFSIRIKAGTPDLRLQLQRRVPHTARRSLELGRAVASCNGAIKPQ